jgi:hypothetical protein
MAVSVIQGPVIPRFGAISDAVDCGGGKIFRILMPADWSANPEGGAGVITFQTSPDNTTFYNLLRKDNKEVQLAVSPGTTVLLEEPITVGWLKIRSGTKDRPVAQSATRAFSVGVDKP